MDGTPLHLTPEQIDCLIQSLHGFHGEYGALDALLDPEREGLLLKGFRGFLEHFLEEREDGTEVARRLARDYFDRNIPFALLMASFNRIKEELIQLVASNTDEPLAHYGEIDRIFERAKRETARQYLIAEAGTAQPFPRTIIRDKILIRLYMEWMEAVRAGITDDLGRFPLMAANESAFARALRYPESMLICLDLKLCDQIEDQHQLIFQQASILYAMLAAGRHEQAYLAYQELTQKVSQLLNMLTVLYLEAETNRINRFFNFVQASLYLPGRKFLCILNLRKLDKINKLYGNEIGNRALDSIEQALRDEYERHQSWMFFTRGIAGDFYLIGYDTTPDRLEDLLARVHRRIGCEETGLPVEIDFIYHGIELTSISELTMENMHLVIQYLTEEARKANRHIHSSDTEAEAMLEWLKKRYRQAVDLRARLTEESTEIFIQPLVTLDNRRQIHAFEVLGRFRDGDGYISAGMFIDDIINMGLAPEFDRLILKAAIRQAETLRGITSRLFINVSPASLGQSEYVDELVAAIQGPLNAFEVVIELTEQVLLNHRDLVYDLHARHGLVFAIDDFGTGYSTLQTVIELALEGSVRYLKVDGSLTRNLTTSVASERIMQITQQMARELDLETVVEFIETVAQAEKLETLEMDFGQGYLLGVPDPVPVWHGKLCYLESRHPASNATPFTL